MRYPAHITLNYEATHGIHLDVDKAYTFRHLYVGVGANVRVVDNRRIGVYGVNYKLDTVEFYEPFVVPYHEIGKGNIQNLLGEFYFWFVLDVGTMDHLIPKNIRVIVPVEDPHVRMVEPLI